MPRFVEQFGVQPTKAAATLLFSLPGMPLLYYGQEIGLIQTREQMQWDKTGSDLFEFYKKLLNLRRDELVLRQGDFEFIENDKPNSVLSYRLELATDDVLVLINFSDLPVRVTPEIGATQTDLIFSNRERGPGIHKVDLNNTNLDAYGFMIIRIFPE